MLARPDDWIVHVFTSDADLESHMTASEPTTAIRSYLGNRWVLVGMATAAIAGGLALNWGWLAAAGIAPILLSLLPCLVMCGLGLCAHRLVGRSGASERSELAANAANCCASDTNVATDEPARQSGLGAGNTVQMAKESQK